MSWIDVNGNVHLTSISELKKGDKVSVSYRGNAYQQTEVTRVRKVECAVIINVKKIDGYPTKFVGYHTDMYASNTDDCILTLNNLWGDRRHKLLEEAEKRSKTLCTRLDALIALKNLKEWLFREEDRFDNEFE